MTKVIPSTRMPFSIPPCNITLSGRSLVSSLAPPLRACSNIAVCLCGSISSLLIDHSNTSRCHCPNVYLGSMSGAHCGGARLPEPWFPWYIHPSNSKDPTKVIITRNPISIPGNCLRESSP